MSCVGLPLSSAFRGARALAGPACAEVVATPQSNATAAANVAFLMIYPPWMDPHNVTRCYEPRLNAWTPSALDNKANGHQT